MQRQLIPTHYLPEMFWLIVEENSFHFNEKHYLQTHGTAVGTKTTVSFANIFVAYIETTTLSRTVFKPTVWKCYINDISPYGTYVNQTSKPSLKKQTCIIRLLNSRLKHLTLRLCFQTRLYTNARDSGKNLSLMQRHILNKQKPSCTRTFHLLSPSKC